MSFTLQFRAQFPKAVQRRFETYWHVMHPQTIMPEDIYRYGWNDEEWSALMLLKERRGDVINEGGSYGWGFEAEFGKNHPMEYVSRKVKVRYKAVDGKPSITVRECDMPEGLMATYQEWIVEAYRYQHLSYQLMRQLSHLLNVKQESYVNSYGRRCIKNASASSGICNTPGTLYAVWPELLPFLDSEFKEELRGRSMRPGLPRDMDKDDLKAFHEVDGMTELTHALQTMSLIPEKRDETYPDLN